MDAIWGTMFYVGIFLLFTEDHWGPGVRDILGAVAHRIRYGRVEVQPLSAPTEKKRSGKMSWLGRVAIGILALPGAVYFSVKVYQELL